MKRNGLLGKKVGMTQIFNESGEIVPVTVIQAGPCVVVQKKTKENDGYSAVQLGFEGIAEKKRNKAMQGHFKKCGSNKTYRHLKEFRITDEGRFNDGQVLTLKDFKVGDYVDVTGVSKGKGFQGVIKRCGKSGGPASHGSHFRRRTGSIGQRTSPGEVFKNQGMPGHMGDEKVTSKNLLVAGLDVEENLILVRGAVSGGKGALLAVYNKAGDYEARISKKEEAKEEAKEETKEEVKKEVKE